MTTAIEDIRRLTAELNAGIEITGDDQDENLQYLQTWFTKNGFDDEFADAFIQFVTDGFSSVMSHLIKTMQGEENGCFELGNVLAVHPDMITAGALSIGCGMFQLGWETHKQYAGHDEMDS